MTKIFSSYIVLTLLIIYTLEGCRGFVEGCVRCHNSGLTVLLSFVLYTVVLELHFKYSYSSCCILSVCYRRIRGNIAVIMSKTHRNACSEIYMNLKVKIANFHFITGCSQKRSLFNNTECFIHMYIYFECVYTPAS